MKNKLTAAPVIKCDRNIMPAPAYTDFVKIFIADELNVSEENVSIRHEQAHIWCEHNRRYKKKYDRELWNISCEIEIARNIYTNQDISVIEAPRSRLSGGYLPDSIKKLPSLLLYAEEIYEWLKNNPEEIPAKQLMCKCDSARSKRDDEQPSSEDIRSIIEEAKNDLDKLDLQRQSQECLKSKLVAIRYKQPSLADELDAILRHRIVREYSYRRPSRRSNNINYIEKGLISRCKRPLVEIFIDRSGSFNASKTRDAEFALKRVLAKYNAQIRSDVFFFGSDRLSAEDINGGGNTPYHLIMDHINRTIPKIAIVITDDDPAGPFSRIAFKDTEILCLPIGCNSTKFSAASGGRDVIFNH